MGYPSTQAIIDATFPQLPSPAVVKRVWFQLTWVSYNLHPAQALLFGVAAWPWLTIATLMLFRISMKRARVRPIHVLRCVLYSFDVGVWVALFVVIVVAIEAWAMLRWKMAFSFEQRTGALGWVIICLMAMAVVRLMFAYRLYLKFDHAVWVVLSSQLIVALTLLTLLCCTPYLLRELCYYLVNG